MNLDKLRAAIRAGDKSGQFFFPRSEETTARKPRVTTSNNDEQEDRVATTTMDDRFASLRLESQRESQQRLLTVFELVHGN